MQPLPAAHRDRLPVRVRPRPDAMGCAMRAGVAAFEAITIFAGRASVATRRRRWPVQHLITARPDQLVERHIRSRLHPGVLAVVAVEEQERASGQQRQQLLELLRADAHGRGTTGHPLMIQHIRPATDRLGQHHQRRKAPPRRDRRGIFRQIGPVDQGAVRRSMRLWATDRRGIQTDQQALVRRGGGQIGGKGARQGRPLDLPVAQGGVEGGPAALKAGGLRELDEGAGGRIGQHSITQVEQRGGGAGVTGVHVAPKRIESGTIHRGTSVRVEHPDDTPWGCSTQVGEPQLV